MSDIPPLRPASKSQDPVIARFQGWVIRHTSSAKGYVEITIGIDRTEKYHALRLTDFPGIMSFEVRQPERVVEDLDDDLLAAIFRDD